MNLLDSVEEWVLAAHRVSNETFEEYKERRIRRNRLFKEAGGRKMRWNSRIRGTYDKGNNKRKKQLRSIEKYVKLYTGIKRGDPRFRPLVRDVINTVDRVDKQMDIIEKAVKDRAVKDNKSEKEILKKINNSIDKKSTPLL